jgi:hypothetical protein
LLNGSTIQLLSGDDPETLKRGGATVIFYNEGQEFDVSALSYGLPAIIDDGGLAIIAANPPQRHKGEWILTLREKILEKEIPGGRYLAFAAGLNEEIDQSARADVGDILGQIDPRAREADDLGTWLPVGDRAYPRFHKVRNIGPVPQLGDITKEWTRKRFGREMLHVGGVDFQASPWHCGVVIRVFKGEGATTPVYHVVDEILHDGFEEEFLVEFDDKEYDHNSFLWIGDASGQFQDGEHTKGRQSFSIFKKMGWRIVPPVEKRSAKGLFSKNPHISDRVSLVNKLLDQGRLIVDPHACPRLAESLKDCELKMHNNSKRPAGVHSHITDALGYVLFWLEPRIKTFKKASAEGVAPISIPQLGPKLF